MLLRLDFVYNLSDEFVNRELAALAFDSCSYCNTAGVHLVLAYNDHIGNLGELSLTDTVAELLVSVIKLCADTGSLHLACYLSRIVCKSTDIRKHYLISSAMGVGLLLVTYLVVKYVNFGIYLPISATMAIIALPLMAILFVRRY